MAGPLPQKVLKIYNLRTTNAMKMKRGTIVYLHNTFGLTKYLGVALNGSGGVSGKLSKKRQKISFLAPFLELSRLYQKA